MNEKDIDAVCLGCKVALASLTTITDEVSMGTWEKWLKTAPTGDAMLLLSLMNIVALKKDADA